MAAHSRRTSLTADPPKTDKPHSPASPNSWWQWILVYPTLAISVAGSIPTAVELTRSARAGVPFGQANAALQQQDLWSKNMLCTGAPFDGLLNEYNVQVDATICRSGDVLVRFWGPQDKKAYRWVPVERFDAKMSSFALIGRAMAQPSPRRSNEVVECQWSPEPGWVVRRVREAGTKQCYDERIRTSTGEVVNRQGVSCDEPCGPKR
jgi:hypothetical protein